MCGIYGAVSFGGPLTLDGGMLDAMGRLLRHRGPDGHGSLRGACAAMGAERLRIVDMTPAGDQPFTDPSGQVWLALNGAIYNAPDLRRRYAGYPFRSRSDVEVALPLYLDRGVAGVTELDGMFGLAIFDARTHQLVLARDRAGEKPLFYSSTGDQVWFASEPQALLGTRPRPPVNEAAVRQFLALGYVLEPHTLFADIARVPAGTALLFSQRGPQCLRYWSPDSCAVGRRTGATPEELEELLADAVARQLRVDVPVGVFTSGGLDSSLLAALAVHAVGSDRLHTFSVGFGDRSFDERSYARRVSRRLGTSHVETEADRSGLRDALDTVVRRVAEPIADPAVLPTYLLSRAAREHVTVVLSGEGADELFGGYPTYQGHRLVRHFGGLPAGTRAAIRRVIERLPTRQGRRVPLEYLLKRFVDAATLPAAPRHLSWFGTGLGPYLGDPAAMSDVLAAADFPDLPDDVAAATLFDYRTYLRDNLLPKVDRATMLCSLEARAPFLDQRVTRVALGLDSVLKVRGVAVKRLLKRAARGWVPRATLHRPKRGLSVPIAAWLNEELRTELVHRLSTGWVERRGVLQPGAARQLLNEHQRGVANHSRALWTLFVFECWAEHWFPEDTE